MSRPRRVALAPPRLAQRYAPYRELSIVYEGTNLDIPVRAPDISTRGMFINTAQKFPKGAVLRICFRLSRTNRLVTARGEVRYCLPGVGVGVEFIGLPEDAQQASEEEAASSAERIHTDPRRAAAGRRLQPRVRGILPVRVWGADHAGKPFAEHVCTIDISNKGANLAAVRTRLSPGDTVGLQYHNRQARFRVVWVVPTSSGSRTHVGLECLQPEKELWPVATPTEGADPYAPSKAREEYSSLAGRRAHTRFPVSGKAYVKKKGGGDGQWAKLGDISLTGCYLQTNQPLDVGRSTTLSIKVAHNEFQATAIVRTCYPGTAMGMEFTFLSNTDRRTLQRLIAHLREFDVVSQ